MQYAVECQRLRERCGSIRKWKTSIKDSVCIKNYGLTFSGEYIVPVLSSYQRIPIITPKTSLTDSNKLAKLNP